MRALAEEEAASCQSEHHAHDFARAELSLLIQGHGEIVELDYATGSAVVENIDERPLRVDSLERAHVGQCVCGHRSSSRMPVRSDAVSLALCSVCCRSRAGATRHSTGTTRMVARLVAPFALAATAAVAAAAVLRGEAMRGGGVRQGTRLAAAQPELVARVGGDHRPRPVPTATTPPAAVPAPATTAAVAAARTRARAASPAPTTTSVAAVTAPPAPATSALPAATPVPVATAAPGATLAASSSSSVDGGRCGWGGCKFFNESDTFCNSGQASCEATCSGKWCLPAPALVPSDGCRKPHAWPKHGLGMFCAHCTAVVAAHPYGGRCDEYCGRMGHVCVASGESTSASCTSWVRFGAGCGGDAGNSSHMVCSCRQPVREDAERRRPAAAARRRHRHPHLQDGGGRHHWNPLKEVLLRGARDEPRPAKKTGGKHKDKAAAEAGQKTGRADKGPTREVTTASTGRAAEDKSASGHNAPGTPRPREQTG